MVSVLTDSVLEPMDTDWDMDTTTTWARGPLMLSLRPRLTPTTLHMDMVDIVDMLDMADTGDMPDMDMPGPLLLMLATDMVATLTWDKK